MYGDAVEHIAEPVEGIDLYEFAGSDEAAKHGCSLATVVTAEEGPVVAADGNTAQCSLGGVVVNGQIAIPQ